MNEKERLVQRLYKSWANRRERDRGENLLLELKMIYASWILWLFTVAFTIIISPLPYTFYIYGKSYAVVIIFLAIFIGAYGGYILGKHFYEDFDAVILHSKKLEKLILWFTCISLLLFPVILFMDIASVFAESYELYGVMISQYQVYILCVIFLLITSFLLAWSIIRVKRMGKKLKEEI